MTKETLQFLFNVLSQVSIRAGQEDFEQVTEAISKAKKELKEELAK